MEVDEQPVAAEEQPMEVEEPAAKEEQPASKRKPRPEKKPKAEEEAEEEDGKLGLYELDPIVETKRERKKVEFFKPVGEIRGHDKGAVPQVRCPCGAPDRLCAPFADAY